MGTTYLRRPPHDIFRSDFEPLSHSYPLSNHKLTFYADGGSPLDTKTLNMHNILIYIATCSEPRRTLCTRRWEKVLKEKVFCISGGGAPVSAFLVWFRHLPRGLSLELLEIPGRGLRKDESHPDSFDAIIDDFYGTIRTKLADSEVNYYLFGYCFGGNIAHSLCLRMERDGFPLPRRIFVTASGPTDEPRTFLFANPTNERRVQDVAGQYFPRSVFPDRDEARRLSRRFTHLLFMKYRRYGTMVPITFEELFPNEGENDPENVEKVKALDFANQTQRLLWLDLSMDDGMRNDQGPLGHIGTDVTALVGKRDPLVSAADVSRWADYVDGEFELVTIDGGHGFAFEEPGCSQCVEAVAVARRKACASIAMG